jgi:hypothetical protein
MSVASKFFDWQRSGLDWSKSPWNSCSPNLVLLRTHLISLHGGQNLGCHQDRPVVGGSLPSSHSFGAAVDWGYGAVHNGPGREFVLSNVIPWLISNSAELGVQAIHDYRGARIWRPPGTSGRPADSDGWRDQPAGSQMGQSWALWLHVETHFDSWADQTPFVHRFRSGAPTVVQIEECEMFTTVRPVRLHDSRSSVRARAGVTVRVPVGRPAKAAHVNVTAVNARSDGFLTAWGDGPVPDVSVLNFVSGQTVANAVTVPVGPDQTIQVRSSADTDLLVDLMGVYS